jgi:hypothetical protein
MGMIGTIGRNGWLSRLLCHRAFSVVAAFGLGVALTVLAVGFAPDDERGLDVGETFETEVTSYFDASGPEPNVICFDRGNGDCGQPLFAVATAPELQWGDRVRATELWLWDEGVARLAYYVEPLDD